MQEENKIVTDEEAVAIIAERTRRLKRLEDVQWGGLVILFFSVWILKIGENIYTISFAVATLGVYSTLLFRYERCPHCEKVADEKLTFCKKCGVQLQEIEEDDSAEEIEEKTIPRDRSFKVKVRKIRWWGAAAAVMFGTFGYFGRQSEWWVEVIFLFFGSLGLYLLLTHGDLVIDKRGVKKKSLLGTYRISWEEVRVIRYGFDVYVLTGEEKSLNIGEFVWDGSNRHDAARYFDDRIDEHHIEFKEDWRAGFSRSKNVRIRKEDDITDESV